MFSLWDNSKNSDIISFDFSLFNDVDCYTHINYSAEFVIALKGGVHVIIQDKEYFVKKNEIIFVQSMLPHRIYTDKNSNTAGMILSFSPLFLEDFTQSLKSAHLKRMITKLSNAHLTYISELLTRRIVAYPQNIADINSILYGLANEILYGNTIILDKNKNDSLAIMKAIDYITAHYSENIHLEDLANTLGINKTYASQIFSKYLNITFRDVLDSIRLKHATKLLQKSQLSISEIAFACGYESLRTFNRIYKKHFNITPSQFRKNTALNYIPDDRIDFSPDPNSFTII